MLVTWFPSIMPCIEIINRQEVTVVRVSFRYGCLVFRYGLANLKCVDFAQNSLWQLVMKSNTEQRYKSTTN